MFAKLKQNKLLYRRVRLLALIMGCLLMGWGLFETWLHFFSDTRISLRMSAGPLVTQRHQVAQQLRDAAIPAGLDLQLIPCAGSQEALTMVETGKLDVAIVSAGILTPDKDHVRQLAALQVEPAHLLLRKELAMRQEPLREILRGKRINLGEPGSSAYALAQELLAFANRKPDLQATKGDFTALTMGMDELMRRAEKIQSTSGAEKELLLSELPDALILVVSMPSKVVQRLVETADYRLVTIPFARAFISHTTPNDGALNRHVDHGFIEQTVIPAGSYLGSEPIPNKDCDTLGLRLLVVANKQVSAAAVFRLMSGIFEGEFARRIKPNSPADQPSPYDMHMGSVAYLNRNKPYLFNQVIETIKKTCSAFGLFSAGAFSFYALLRTKRSKSAGDYLKDIRQIDLIAHGSVSDSQAPKESAALARYLDGQLTELKAELIRDCCNKKFKNEMMLLNILTLLADTRSQIGELVYSQNEKPTNQTSGVINVPDKLKLAG